MSEERPTDKTCWQTPDSFLDLVREFAGGPIGLDPCTTPENPTGAISWIAPPRDGLAEDWYSPGLVYVNPPYGRGIGPWIEKMVDYGWCSQGVIGLVPASTDTAWWQCHASTAEAICLWRGRIRFRGAGQGAKFPSAVLYWGKHEKAFRRVFGPHGWIP